jgi:hypothetical protein
MKFAVGFVVTGMNFVAAHIDGIRADNGRVCSETLFLSAVRCTSWEIGGGGAGGLGLGGGVGCDFATINVVPAVQRAGASR